MVARHPETPIDSVRQILLHRDGSLANAIASDSFSAPEILLELSGEAALTSERAYHLAKNRRTPATALAILASSGSPDVRREVARNWNTDADTLIRLTHDDFIEIVADTVRNPNTPRSALAETASLLLEPGSDGDTWAREEYFMHDRPSAVNLRAAAGFTTRFHHNRWAVLRRIGENPNTPGETLRALVGFGLSSPAGNPSTPPDAIEALVANVRPWGYDERDDIIDDGDILIDVASNPSTPVSILARIAWDSMGVNSHHIVQWNVARNPSSPPDTILELARVAGSDPEMADAIRGNPSAPSEAIAALRGDRY